MAKAGTPADGVAPEFGVQSSGRCCNKWEGWCCLLLGALKVLRPLLGPYFGARLVRGFLGCNHQGANSVKNIGPEVDGMAHVGRFTVKAVSFKILICHWQGRWNVSSRLVKWLPFTELTSD